MPGFFDHHVYLWNGIGHLISAAGLLSVFVGVLGLGSLAFQWKTMYWTIMTSAVIFWVAAFGIAQHQAIRYGPQSDITDFTFSASDNRVSRAIIRWQIEPEMRGWWRGSPLKRSHGWISVTVVRIVPIAIPGLLDCYCSRCCMEEDAGTKSAK